MELTKQQIFVLTFLQVFRVFGIVFAVGSAATMVIDTMFAMPQPRWPESGVLFAAGVVFALAGWLTYTLATRARKFYRAKIDRLNAALAEES